MSWIQESRTAAISIVEAIGLNPHNIALRDFHVDGDTLTVIEFVRDDDGRRIIRCGRPLCRTRTYRLHPAEPIEEQA